MTSVNEFNECRDICLREDTIELGDNDELHTVFITDYSGGEKESSMLCAPESAHPSSPAEIEFYVFGSNKLKVELDQDTYDYVEEFCFDLMETGND